MLPNFAYQLQLASPSVEEAVGRSPAHLKAFLNAMYGGRNTLANPPKPGFVAREGVDLQAICSEGAISDSPLVKGEEMEFYVEELNKQGLGKMLNWYRTCAFSPSSTMFLCSLPGLLLLTIFFLLFTFIP